MPCRRYVARSLVAVVLVVSDNRIHVFDKERIPLLVPSQSREMIGNESAFMLPHIKHDDTIWKRFPHHYPFVKQIHRSPVDPPSKGPVMQGIDISLLLTRIRCWTNNHVAGNLRRPCDATLSGVAWASQTTSKPILKFFVHIILAKLASWVPSVRTTMPLAVIRTNLAPSAVPAKFLKRLHDLIMEVLPGDPKVRYSSVT